MSGSIVAKRYALALLQIAKEQQLLKEMVEDLRVVKEVAGYTPELKAVLHSSKLTKEEKKSGVNARFCLRQCICVEYTAALSGPPP